MATGEDRPKYTHYSLAQPRDREHISRLYGSERAQNGSFPTNIVQCLQLDHVGSRSRPKHFRQQYVNGGLARAKYLYSQDVLGHTGCVNAINFSNLGEDLLITGGDDEKVQLWKVAEMVRGKCSSLSMDTPHCSNIFSASFSCDNAYIYSGGNDADLIKHDAATGKMVSVHHHTEAVYSVSTHPLSPDIVVTASEDGLVRTIDTRLPRFTEDMTLVEDFDAFQCATFNPVEPCLIATGSSRHGTALYDTRTRKKVFSYSSGKYHVFGEDVVSVCFSRSGQHLFTMQRRQLPYLYQTTRPNVAIRFMDEKGDYMNSVTMKSGCFVGTNDEYVASGSDDFRIYIWKIPEDLEAAQSSVIDRGVVPSPHLVVPGHRSIANQIRYSPTHHLLCSSGVEKVVKLWSHLPLSSAATVQHSGGPPSRQRYTQREFLQLTMNEDSDDSMMPTGPDQEDRSVLAFFDALVNQEQRTRDQQDESSSDSNDSFFNDTSSTDSFGDDIGDGDMLVDLPFSRGPIDFMRYPYPDEEPGRATWDFMTPQERWDWHHGRRDWYYEDEGGEARSGTLSSVETGNTSSFEPPWSDESEMEQDDDGDVAGESNVSVDEGGDVDLGEKNGGEEEKEEEEEEGKGGMRKGRRYRSGVGHSKSKKTQNDGTATSQERTTESSDLAAGAATACTASTSETGVKRKPQQSRKRTSKQDAPINDMLFIDGAPCSLSQTSNEATPTQQQTVSDSEQPSTSTRGPQTGDSSETTPPRQGRKQRCDHERKQYTAEDFLKPIPATKFYSSRQNSNRSTPDQPPSSETSCSSNNNNRVQKKLCSQEHESSNTLSSSATAANSSHSEAVRLAAGTTSGAHDLRIRRHSEPNDAAGSTCSGVREGSRGNETASRKSETSSRKGKRTKRQRTDGDNVKLPRKS